MSPNHRRPTLIASVLLSFAVPSWSQDTADPGKAAVDAQCNSCHPIGARVGSGYTPEGWDTVLRMMTNHGVAIAPDGSILQLSDATQNRSAAPRDTIPFGSRVHFQWSARTLDPFGRVVARTTRRLRRAELYLRC